MCPPFVFGLYCIFEFVQFCTSFYFHRLVPADVELCCEVYARCRTDAESCACATKALVRSGQSKAKFDVSRLLAPPAAACLICCDRDIHAVAARRMQAERVACVNGGGWVVDAADCPSGRSPGDLTTRWRVSLKVVGRGVVEGFPAP